MADSPAESALRDSLDEIERLSVALEAARQVVELQAELAGLREELRELQEGKSGGNRVARGGGESNG